LYQCDWSKNPTETITAMGRGMNQVFALALLASASAFNPPAARFLRHRHRAAALPRMRQVRDGAAPLACKRSRALKYVQQTKWVAPHDPPGPHVHLQALVSPLCLAGRDDAEVVFNANEGWQADHNKAAAAMAAGGHQQLKIKYCKPVLLLHWLVYDCAILAACRPRERENEISLARDPTCIVTMTVCPLRRHLMDNHLNSAGSKGPTRTHPTTSRLKMAESSAVRSRSIYLSPALLPATPSSSPCISVRAYARGSRSPRYCYTRPRRSRADRARRRARGQDWI
jgi:hypothetical protein